jgi:aspartyl-tRNA(Asn)/glutamyl-tRNA(Gln) amidotransferase subunit A
MPAAEALAAFEARRLSPVELMEAVVERIERLDPLVNAITDRYFEEALAEAKNAERSYGGHGPAPRALEGLPIAIKDETEIAGRVSTSGSFLLREHVGTHDAPVVERIRASGGIVHARTATPEFSCVPYTHSRLWGITRNPWNLDFSPGGSSGGAAAALASGMTSLADGSDIGGSIRVPAAYSGVVGYKPPYGRVPSSPPYSLDTYNHQGPLARTVADCALLENVISGWHPRDSATVRESVIIPRELKDVRGLRVALSVDLGGYRVDAGVVRNTLAAGEALRDRGAVVESVSLEWSPARIRVAMFAHFAAIFAAEMHEFVEGQHDLLSDYTLRFLELSQESGSGLLHSMELEAALQNDLATVFENHDVLICPTNASEGLVAGDSYLARGPEVDGVCLDSVYDAVMTTPFNLTSRCPVLSVPSGFGANGVPTGVQIVGAPFDDRTVFEVGMALEQGLALELVPGIRPPR